jgi:hypothetical protein
MTCVTQTRECDTDRESLAGSHFDLDASTRAPPGERIYATAPAVKEFDSRERNPRKFAFSMRTPNFLDRLLGR